MKLFKSIKSYFKGQTHDKFPQRSHTFSFISWNLLIILGTVGYSSYSILVNLSKVNDRLLYNSAFLYLLIEITKLATSLIFWSLEPKSSSSSLLPSSSSSSSSFKSASPPSITFMYVLSFSIPAVLYCCTNNIAVHLQLLMDPATYQVLGNLKILSTAVLYRIIMNRVLTCSQWFALFILFLSACLNGLGGLYQEPPSSSSPHLLSSSSSSSLQLSSSPQQQLQQNLQFHNQLLPQKDFQLNSLLLQKNAQPQNQTLRNLLQLQQNQRPQQNQLQSKQPLQNQPHSHTYITAKGLLGICVYTLMSGGAGVYNECILKKHKQVSINVQNSLLYSYGVLLNGVVWLSSVSQVSDLNAFKDFNIYVWIIVFTQSFIGLVMSIVMKHSNNITKLFIVASSALLTTILSVTLLSITIGWYFGVSLLFFVLSLSLYYRV